MAEVMNSIKGLVGEGSPVAEAAANFDAWYENSLGPAHYLTRDMPLMQPSVAAAIAMAYLAFVVFVPMLFKATGFSIKLKPIMRLYNLFMVVLSGYMGTKSILLARESNDTLFCVPMAEGRAGVEMAQLVWIFTFSKVIEFLDTVFMIMEGRMRQVSFLHVYHHVSILSYWFTISWVLPGSDAYFSLAGNSYIHVLMYGYYLLASFGYSPWWKYYVSLADLLWALFFHCPLLLKITKAQIFQFCCFCAQSIYVGYLNEDTCDFPPILSKTLLWYMFSLIALFMHFLVTNKGKGKSAKASAKKVQ